MTIAGLFAGLLSPRRHSTPHEATPNATRITMIPRDTIPRYSSCYDLLIRRSWVRNPPGSFTYKRLRNYLAGLLAGLRAENRTVRRTPDQVAFELRLRQVERDRELTAINIALRSGTAAKVLG